MNKIHDFHGPNAGYLWALYERYLENRESVDPKTRTLFDTWSPEQLSTQAEVEVNGSRRSNQATQSTIAPQASGTPYENSEKSLQNAVAVANYAQAIREYGHLGAHSNPLYEPPGDPSLSPDFHGITETELNRLPPTLVLGPVSRITANALDATKKLKEIYCGGIGYDYDHLTDPIERGWLRAAAETRSYRKPFDPKGENGIRLLERLTKVEGFEQFLHKTFVGKKRFSIEGLDMMVPVIDELVRVSLNYNIQEVIIGMAHRGRLNVLAHVLNKDYQEIFREFKEPLSNSTTNAQGYLGRIGDVKYHSGALRVIDGMQVKIAPNPSHLEHVNPVVEGMARAAATDTGRPGPPIFNHHATLPIQIHGDAAFSGQGIVAETLNFSDLKGYENGGTIHIIANNQVGFTTDPRDSRSTRYASDLAKGFKIPIVHVNANNPIDCLEVACLAAEYRNQFHKDFLIDLIGYRRFGHNEGDEPRFTQPTMYEKIDTMPTVRQIWGGVLVENRFIAEDDITKVWDKQWSRMQQTYDMTDATAPTVEIGDNIHKIEPGVAKRTITALTSDRLRQLHTALTAFPDGFTPHARMKRVIKRREQALDDIDAKGIDWGLAEQLAFATILADGIPIRLTGEDVKRGTFSHRHAVYFDANSGAEFAPLHHLPQAEASFEIHNSPLTENGMIGFEFGFNIEKPDCLTIWEAQFGDFVNGAQAILDEYITSGRAKWNLAPSLVLLLPHGYEGQGPDHSSARLERFLQMTAEKNMRVMNCTTAAQFYHLMRRQALLLEKDPLPLIVMTPKSLLRHPAANSSLRELAEGRFEAVIDDHERDPKKVKRLILCSGKVYVDLISSDQHAERDDIAIVRIEQLYPFPKNELVEVINRYTGLEDLVWVQEEPRNMGAWRFMQPRLGDILPVRRGAKTKKVDFDYIGRRRFASPAEGYSTWHKVTQAQIIADAFDLNYRDKVLEAKRSS